MTRLVLRALLRASPGWFRERHGAEFMAVHDERARAAGGFGARFALGVREVVGLAAAVARLRLGAGAPGPGRGTTGRREGSMFDGMLKDLRLAARTLKRNPAYSVVAVLILALGIGANVAIFSAANAYFFRPLPFGDPDRLVLLYETNPEFGWTDADAAPANALDWREQVEAFEDLALYSGFPSRVAFVREDGEPVLYQVSTVSGNFFDVLGVRPALGRAFTWEETWAPDDDVVILSHELWRSDFGADPGVIGRMVDFGGGRAEIVGVMPPGFSFPQGGTQMWTPWGFNTTDREQVFFRRAHYVRPVARLAAGVSVEEADAQLQVVVRRLSEEYPTTNRVMGAGLTPIRTFLTRDVRTRLSLLGGAVTLLLLLACVNVANLVLVRGVERGREVALRHALGAGRWRVVRLMLAESLTLASAGGALGLGIGWLGVRLMERFAPLGIDGATGIALDGRVVLFVAVVTVLSAVVFGLVPALRSSKASVQDALKEGSRGTGGLARSRLVGTLVAAEVALALLLVTGAGLLARSFVALRSVDPGFTTEGTLAVRFGVPSSRYPERDQVLALQDAMIERMEAIPGVLAVGSVSQLPVSGTSWSSQMQAEGWPPERVIFEVIHRRADAGYFEALGTPLIRGRMFGPDDRAGNPLVMLVNETFVREHFPGEDPIGLRVANDRNAAANPEANNWFEIIGVVADQHQVDPSQPPRAEVFESRHQDWARANWYVLRTDGDPLAVVPAIRAALREMDPTIPLGDVRPLRDVWSTSMARETFLLALLGVFGAVALLVAAVGVYGVTAQAARARTREMGIRMALGASAPSVVAMMVRQGMVVVGLGLGVGVVAMLLTGRALEAFLFAVEPTDPATLAAMVALMAAVAAAACWIPARRATAADPVRSLRAE